MKEPVVAGTNFNPQNKAPLAIEYELTPIRIKRIQMLFEIGVLVLFLNKTTGSNIKPPIIYLNPAIVKGPIVSNPNFTMIKVDDQIRVVNKASTIARYLALLFDELDFMRSFIN